ncbi:MAG: DegT/DnrJ/EryC1/StrS family aminotransferase [Candidatus Hydrogenedentes bacterium]|nr:DegT/DnrJ/EryC1/StrS family aminotransferase [Candidatus Hydrogenedentota bacterium]
MRKLALYGGEPVRQIPYPRWPEVSREDEESVLEVVRSGNWWMYSYGTDEFAGTVQGTSRVMMGERRFAEMHNAKFAYATASGSACLEIACRALGLKPGDEVITTPYTFIATTTCILNAGAIPVYVDIDPETYNLDADRIESAITSRTRAIIPVHFGGCICDIDSINTIARKHGLHVIEDAAHAHGASLRGGRFAGTLGDIGIFSLQQSKLLTCGEGGMITTNDPELADASWSLRHYGRTRTGKWYEHFRLGWHYRMTEMQGALLLSQLEKLPAQNEVRRRNAKVLRKGLAEVPGILPVRQHPEAEQDVYYVLCLRYLPEKWEGLSKSLVLAALAAEGVPVFGGYSFPLYENPLFQSMDFNSPESIYQFGRNAPVADFLQYREKCPVTERACHTESMWITHDMLSGTNEDTLDIVRAYEKVWENRSELLKNTFV